MPIDPAHLETLATSTRWPAFDEALRAARTAVAFPKDIPLPETLTNEQRQLVDVLLTRSSFVAGGLPNRVQFRRRWLGAEPGGALERRHAFVDADGTTVQWPLWRILRALVDANQEERLTAIVPDRFERLDARVDLALWHPYGQLGRNIPADELAGIDDGGAAWATRRLDEMKTWPAPTVLAISPRAVAVGTPLAMLGFDHFEGAYGATNDGHVALLLAAARGGTTLTSSLARWFPFFAHPNLKELVDATAVEDREAMLRTGAEGQADGDVIGAVLQLWPDHPLPVLQSLIEPILNDPLAFSTKAKAKAAAATWKAALKATPVAGSSPTTTKKKKATAAKTPTPDQRKAADE